MRIKKILSVMLAILMFAGALAVGASADNTALITGEYPEGNTRWEYNPATAVLTFYATGSDATVQPGTSGFVPQSPYFGSFGLNVEKIVVSEGINYLGELCFAEMDLVKEVVLPSTLKQNPERTDSERTLKNELFIEYDYDLSIWGVEKITNYSMEASVFTGAALDGNGFAYTNVNENRASMYLRAQYYKAIQGLESEFPNIYDIFITEDEAEADTLANSILATLNEKFGTSFSGGFLRLFSLLNDSFYMTDDLLETGTNMTADSLMGTYRIYECYEGSSQEALIKKYNENSHILYEKVLQKLDYSDARDNWVEFDWQAHYEHYENEYKENYPGIDFIDNSYDRYLESLAYDYSKNIVLIGNQTEQPDNPDTPDQPADNTCSHICHKNGFLGFIWKIVNFFNRLFRIKQTCECGAAHY